MINPLLSLSFLNFDFVIFPLEKLLIVISADCCFSVFDRMNFSEIKGIVSALQQIREKAQKDGQKKKEETISRSISFLI